MSDKSDDRPAVPTGGEPLADVHLDTDLMNALVASQGRDEEPLAQLKCRHERLVFNELRRRNLRGFDAEDVASVVWEQVWKMGLQGTWNVNRARHSSDPFVPLLKRICNSKAMDFHRREMREKNRRERIVEAVAAHGHDWRGALAGSGRRVAATERPAPAGVPARLEAAVAALPERLRRVYELHARGFTNRKISAEVGCSWGEVSRRLTKAREHLGMSRTVRSR